MRTVIFMKRWRMGNVDWNVQQSFTPSKNKLNIVQYIYAYIYMKYCDELVTQFSAVRVFRMTHTETQQQQQSAPDKRDRRMRR